MSGMPNNGVYIRVAGNWVKALTIYRYESGSWVPAKVYVRLSGVWVEVS